MSHSRGRLTGCRRVDDGHARVVTDETEDVARWRERNVLNPSSAGTVEFTTNSVEGELLTPGGRFGSVCVESECEFPARCLPESLQNDPKSYSLGIDSLDESRKHPRLGIRTPSSDQHVVGMPIDRQDGGADRLLDSFGHPPIVFSVKGADSDDSVG